MAVSWKVTIVGFIMLSNSPILALFPLNPFKLLSNIEMSAVFPAGLLPLLSFLLLLLLLPLLVSFTVVQPAVQLAASVDGSPPESCPLLGQVWIPEPSLSAPRAHPSLGKSSCSPCSAPVPPVPRPCPGSWPRWRSSDASTAGHPFLGQNCLGSPVWALL